MKKRLKLLIMVSALLCLSLAIVASADSCTKTLYVDGSQVGTVTDGNGLRLTWISPHIMIGADGRYCHVGTATIGSSSVVWNQYSGAMDEFAIYKGILASNRIKLHYNDAVSNNYAQYKSDVQSDSPLLWLKFDDVNMANWASAANSGSVPINGIYRQTDIGIAYGYRQFTSTTGIASGSNAVKFPIALANSTSGAWVEMDDSGGQFSTNIDGNVTIELWIDCNSTDTNNNPLLFQHNGSNSYTLTGGYGLEVNGPSQLGIIGGGQIDYMNLPYDINDSNWHHIVVTYASNYVPVTPPTVSTYPKEVMKDNPVLWLRFENQIPTDNSAADGNHWVGYGGAATIVSKVGSVENAVLLKWPTGSGSGLEGVYGVAATNNPNSPPDINSTYEVYGYQYAFVPAPNSITFELWVKSLYSLQQMLNQEAATNTYEYGMYFQQIGDTNQEPYGPAVSNSDDQIRIFVGKAVHAPIYTGVPSPFDQKWHQLVVVYDVNDVNYGPAPSLNVQLYGDGQLIASFFDPNGSLGPELSHIMLGAQNDVGNSYNILDVYMAEFAIYAGVLGPDRVLAHYTAWQPKNCADMQSRGSVLPGDMAGNCNINFVDFADFASQWRLCNDPCDPKCAPNW